MDINKWFLRDNYQPTNASSGFFTSQGEDNESVHVWKDIDLILMTSEASIASSVNKNIHLLYNHFPFQRLFFAGSLIDNNAELAREALHSFYKQGITSFFAGGNLRLASELAAENDLRVTCIANALPQTEEIRDNYKYIGYQRHLSEYKALKYIEEFCPDSLSLGQMKSNGHLLEPLLRDTEVLYVNLNVIRSAEVPGLNTAWPSGLNTEELCQIAKIAGSSNRLKAILLDAGDLAASPGQFESRLIVEFFWYLLEGIQCKQKDHPAFNSNISEYVVNMADFDTELIFVKSNISNKWWLRIQDSETNPFLSCAHEEYQQSVRNEIPERLLRHIL